MKTMISRLRIVSPGRFKSLTKDFIGLYVLIFLLVVFTLLSGGKLMTAYNTETILDQSLQVIIGGLGMIFVIAMGSIDISIGANSAVSATIGCVLSTKFGSWIMIPSTLLIALFIGFLNGLVISRFKVASIMVTLAMLILLRGMLAVLISGKDIFAPAFLTGLNKFDVRIVVLVVLVAIIWYIFEYTWLGDYCKAMGENEIATRYIGIDTQKIRLLAFMISGLMAGFVGLIQMMKFGGASPYLGSFVEMKVLIAIFLGGVPLIGGYGSKIYKLIFGAITASIIINGLNLINIGTEYSQAIQGICLILILVITTRIAGRSGKKT